jgi:hypothetical protein
MRITAESLLKIAGDYVSRRTRQERDLLAVYLAGSLLTDNPVLGGTADIDLFFVHINPPAVEREVERLTDDVHLDINHSSRDLYRNTRSLRLDPWLGPLINQCKILHDPQHFLDFTQAGVRAQFDRPDNVAARSRRLYEQARQAWLGFQLQPPESGARGLSAYLQTLSNTANAVALLIGPPLTERRFLLQFSERAAALQRPGLYAGLLGLLGVPHTNVDLLRGWTQAWQNDFRKLHSLSEPDLPVNLHPARLNYYLRSFEAFLEHELPNAAALWPMLVTWTKMAALLQAHSAPAASWEDALSTLGLGGEALSERLEALDAYLDSVEETIENWAQANGA